MDSNYIRNFSIIAHIDHGKSTLADRILDLTGAVSSQDMREQFMDRMDLERERGITIKGKAVRLRYTGRDGRQYELNLIDTPGHVDFSYEVSRALTACEGALLVVDASQGVEAQTIANAYLAMEHDLVLIPVVNKIDLPQAQPEKVALEMCQLFGFAASEVVFTSAKDGKGVPQLLEAVVDRIPAPKGDAQRPLRALVFDSVYNSYKGIVAYVRVFEGSIKSGETIHLMSTGFSTDALEVGQFAPLSVAVPGLSAGQVGYIATGFKDVRQCRVGDTITLLKEPAQEPLPGYQPLKPMVFAGLYPADGEEFDVLRDALEKLQLNDAALSFAPENSPALGFGFRAGFLGLLHMEIVQERLEREYGLAIVATAPSVGYQVVLPDGTVEELDNPSKLPEPHLIAEVREPWLDLTVVTPSRFIGAVME
ncbi:MAG: translation elongation factor 4, partial [Chloroflexota bacterium]|nr:translation elongation factor 4 [Chloroflexota bacterium]